MTTELPPRIIALAIAELAIDLVRAAWRDLEAWRVLTGAGVPVLELRLALETPETLTEPLARLREWNERGVLVEHGVPGTGKTHAAILWLLSTVDRNLRYPSMRGLSMCWLAAATWPYQDRKLQDAWLRRGEGADVLVLDDLGAGASAAEWTRQPMEGMLMNRISAGKRTMLITNANAAETRSWLGPRLVSRIEMGGRIVEIKSRKDLRKPDTTEVDEYGRSATWHRNAEIVEALGCRRVDGTLEVGHVLEAATAKAVAAASLVDGDAAKTLAWAPCRSARELLGLDPKAIQARAREIDARERSVCGDIATTYGVEVPEGGITAEVAMSVVRQLLAKNTIAVAPEPVRPRHSVPAHVADDAVEAASELALRHHMHVRETSDGTWEVRRWKGAGHASTESDLEASGFASKGQAWLGAAMLLRDEVEGEAVPA